MCLCLGASRLLQHHGNRNDRPCDSQICVATMLASEQAAAGHLARLHETCQEPLLIPFARHVCLMNQLLFPWGWAGLPDSHRCLPLQDCRRRLCTDRDRTNTVCARVDLHRSDDTHSLLTAASTPIRCFCVLIYRRGVCFGLSHAACLRAAACSL